mmetsp:Transcript_9222/g.28056  ORF Transcript_9222/g.28056 Transcript_9222/m.28056 type:complete len:250 (-) Transcript_9222:229-978(-)
MARVHELGELGVVRHQDGLGSARDVTRVDHAKLVLGGGWAGQRERGRRLDLGQLPVQVAHEHVGADVAHTRVIVLGPLLQLCVAARVHAWRVQRDEALAGGHAHGSLDAGVLCSLQKRGLVVELCLIARLGHQVGAVYTRQRGLEAGNVAKVTLYKCDVGQASQLLGGFALQVAGEGAHIGLSRRGQSLDEQAARVAGARRHEDGPHCSHFRNGLSLRRSGSATPSSDMREGWSEWKCRWPSCSCRDGL